MGKVPNIIIYMSDEHNPKYSSVYGNEKVKTPNMERLSEMGTVFENAYCPSPLCRPSRSAFMTGRPDHIVQAYNNCSQINFDYPSYGQKLSEQDIHTTYIGKFDVYNTHDKLGFDEIYHPIDRQPPGDTNMSRNPLKIREGSRERANGYGIKEDAFAHDKIMIDEAVSWLKNKSLEMDKNWTLTVNTAAPHFPHYVSQELWDLYQGEGDLPQYGPESESAKHAYARDLRNHFETDYFNEEQIHGLRKGYYGKVTYVDRELGRLIDALEASDQLDNTIIVYTSDHGEMLGKFGMWWKCSLYEDSVRIPMIIAGPGFEKGKRVETPVSLLDLQATIFSALKRDYPYNWWGTPLQTIKDDDKNRPVFAEYHGHGVHSSAYMIRKGDWKLIYNVDAKHQLYNLSQDPEELNNLFEDRTDIYNQLQKELLNICDPEKECKKAEKFIQKQLQQI